MEQCKRNHPKALFTHPSDTCRFIPIAGIGGTRAQDIHPVRSHRVGGSVRVRGTVLVRIDAAAPLGCCGRPDEQEHLHQGVLTVLAEGAVRLRLLRGGRQRSRVHQAGCRLQGDGVRPVPLGLEPQRPRVREELVGEDRDAEAGRHWACDGDPGRRRDHECMCTRGSTGDTSGELFVGISADTSARAASFATREGQFAREAAHAGDPSPVSTTAPLDALRARFGFALSGFAKAGCLSRVPARRAGDVPAVRGDGHRGAARAGR